MAFFKLPERKRKRVGAERGREEEEERQSGEGEGGLGERLESISSVEEILAVPALTNPVGISLCRTQEADISGDQTDLQNIPMPIWEARERY